MTTLRRGASLAEVLVAITLLGGTLLSFATFTQKFTHNTAAAAMRSTASDLAVERIEAVRQATTYAAIDGFVATEPSISGFPGYVRRTYVRRTQSTTVDHKTVTVVVASRALGDSVVKTSIVAAF